MRLLRILCISVVAPVAAIPSFDSLQIGAPRHRENDWVKVEMCLLPPSEVIRTLGMPLKGLCCVRLRIYNKLPVTLGVAARELTLLSPHDLKKYYQPALKGIVAGMVGLTMASYIYCYTEDQWDSLTHILDGLRQGLLTTLYGIIHPEEVISAYDKGVDKVKLIGDFMIPSLIWAGGIYLLYKQLVTSEHRSAQLQEKGILSAHQIIAVAGHSMKEVFLIMQDNTSDIRGTLALYLRDNNHSLDLQL